VALLPRSRLLGTLGEALARVRPGAGAPPSRTITFITGPSRTADIELELVVGVHGPKHLTVLLLDSA
jgi:L-lactate dehydrogenase complex protein LldG